MPPISLFDRSVIYEEPLVPRLFRPYQWKKAAAKGMRGSEPSEAERGSELIEKMPAESQQFRKLAATVAATAYTHSTNLCGCTHHIFIRYMSRWTQIMYVMPPCV